MRFRRVPRPLADSLRAVTAELAPLTGLASIQRVWVEAVGPAIAAEAEPVAERAGELTVRCRTAVWAQEIELMGPSLAATLNAALGARRVTTVRATAGAGQRAPRDRRT